MALVECKNCGRRVSDKATACSGCGRLIDSQLNQSSGYIPPYKSDGTRTNAGVTATSMSYSTLKKGKNPGDAAAEVEKAKIKADVEAKARLDADIALRKGHHREQQYMPTSSSDGSSAFSSLFVVIGGIIIIVAIFCPPVGIPVISLYALGRLVSSFGKD